MKMITAAMLSTLSLMSYSAFATVTEVTNYKSPIVAAVLSGPLTCNKQDLRLTSNCKKI